MKAHWFQILTALAEDDLHGLAIVRSVLDQTEGTLQLWPATLYGSLEALTEAGLIRELGGDEHPADESSQRRYYRLTEEGRVALRREAERLGAFASLALNRLGSA